MSVIKTCKLSFPIDPKASLSSVLILKLLNTSWEGEKHKMQSWEFETIKKYYQFYLCITFQFGVWIERLEEQSVSVIYLFIFLVDRPRKINCKIIKNL